MPNPITIVLADDHLSYIEAMDRLLSMKPDLEVVATVSNGNELINAVRKFNPEVIITDISMPFMDGIEASKEILKNFPNTKIIVLSNFNTLTFVECVADIGVNGYVSKCSSFDTLYNAIQHVTKGGFYFKTVESNPGNKSSAIKNLSKREVEILELISKGKSSSQISKQLYISKDTVKATVRISIKSLVSKEVLS